MSAWFRRHPKLFFLLMNAVVIVALDQIAGDWTRVDATSYFRRPHPYYHHDLRPSIRARTQWGERRYEILTNSLAFRDGAIRQIAARGDRRRVLLLGDSFTEGVGVTWEESFAGRLARAFGGDVEILNAGVIGYSPKIYRLKTEYLLERVKLEFDELFVFIDMSDIPNELIYAVWEPSDREPPPSPPPGPWSELRRRSLVLRTIDRAIETRRPPVAWNFHGMPFADDLDALVLRDPEFDDREHWTLAYKYARPGMDLAAANMGALASLCEARGLPLTIVIYPWPANILAGELEHPQVGLWRAFAAERGLRFVDLFPAFIRDGADPRKTIARYFIDGDVHWNAAGHQLVAREIAPLLGQASKIAIARFVSPVAQSASPRSAIASNQPGRASSAGAFRRQSP